MTCPSCGATPPAGSTFCNACGAGLELTCASCGATPPAGSTFCNECGAKLASGAVLPAPADRDPRDYTPGHLADKILQSKSALEGERKQVTVLFADVKGSMELAEGLDPEEWHRILDRFFQILTDGVHRFEGTVNQYTGDGIMALFGAPIAHEDHAQRACYAALHLLGELRSYALEVRRAQGLDFAVRIGLNSGEVVVGKIGDDLRMDYTAQGHTVGLAQRVESLAESNACCLSARTAEIVSGYFDLEDLGDFSVKGVSEPVRAFGLRGVGKARTRLDLSRARGFTRFVGRDREMESLESALEAAIAGNGQVVGVVAQAGTGKSRLCLEFVEGCRARGIRVNEAHCPAHGKTIAFMPLLEMLRSIFDIRDADSDHEVRRKIAGELLLLDDAFQELLPLIFDFLGVPDPDRPAPDLPPEGRQRQMMAFVRHLTQARSQREPSVLLLDDVHWIDPGSDAFLAVAAEAVQSTRTLLLVNFRPEYHADWMSKSYYRQLPLTPLGPEAVAELLADLLGTHPSVRGLAPRVHERTAGNPFFVEEVVRSLVERGHVEGVKGAYRLVSPIESLEIPASVQTVLAARIDRLAEREKQVLQAASVIGKEFPETIVRHVAELPEGDLAAALAVLVQSEFVYEQSLFPEVEYAFKHPLTQEVAYESQLESKRATGHGAVARAIEELDPERLDERAALLAHHWEKAGNVAMAAQWHGRAARWCSLDNPPESLRHWRRVRELVRADRGIPDASELLLEADSEILNFGWQHGLPEEESETIFEEGRALAQQLGDTAQKVRLLVNRSVNFSLGGSPLASLGPAEEALPLAEGTGDPELRLYAYDALMNARFYAGDLAAGVEAIDRLIAVAPELAVAISARNVPIAWYPGYRAWFLVERGRLSEAGEALHRTAEALRRLDHTQSQSWCASALAHWHVKTGQPAEALAAGRRAVEFAERVGANLALTLAYGFYGEAAQEAGESSDAVTHLEHGLDIARRTGAFLSLEATLMASLAEAQLGLGELEVARVTAQDAVRASESRGTKAYGAQAHLSHARVLFEIHAVAEAAAELDRCEALVEVTGAQSLLPHALELRSRIAHRAGDRSAAEHALREAHRLYTEMGATGHAERVGRELPGLVRE